MAKVIHGGGRGDQLVVTADKTQAYGLSGNDTIISNGKADVLLVGGSGNDSLIMFGGTGTLNGGKGSDTFELTYSVDKPVSAVIEDLEPSSDRIIVNHVGTTAPQLTSSVKGNDVIWTDGGNFNLTLKSVRDNDYFDGDAPEQVWEVLELTNAEREKETLSALTLSEGLMKGAATRANEITGLAQIGALSDHTRPESVGSTPYYTVLVDKDLTLKQKYTSPRGENLDGGARSPEEVVIKDWMNSDSHRENILKERYQKIGIGYNYYDEDKSDLRWYWTQLFANDLKSVSSVDESILSTASIESNAVSKTVTLTDNTYDNAVYGVTISGTSSADSISNTGLIAYVSTGEGDDTITNSGANVTICAGTGEDSISLSSDAKENLILYAIGDGSDTISGINKDDTLSIVGGEYNRLITVGDKDIVVRVGDDSITLLNAAKAGVNVYGTESKLIRGAESGSNTISNLDDNVTIESGNGDDSIRNFGDKVTIDAGAGNDSIRNFGDKVTIDTGAGNDSISDYGNNVSIESGDGDDTIYGSNFIINGGTGNDSISGSGTIYGGDGNDTINSSGLIDGGDGDDIIENLYNSNATINGGAGNDSVFLTFMSTDNLILYNVGEGNDTIYGFDKNDTLSIAGGSYIRSTIVNDIVFAVGTDSVILLDAASLGASLNVLGEGQDGEYVSGFIELTEDNDTFYNTLRGATIQALGGDDSITNDAEKVSINGNDGNDTISHDRNDRNYNTSLGSGSFYNNVSITGGNGKDFITNNDWYVEIDAGNDDDTVASDGSEVTIAGGLGDDSISLSGGARNNLIQYTKGDGNDTIRGFNEDDSLIMLEVKNDCSPRFVDNNIIVSLGDGSIALIDTAYLSTFNIEARWIEVNKEENLITLSAFNDVYFNTFEEVTIEAFGGDDFIYNTNTSSVTINGGEDNDWITSSGDSVIINGDDGDDTLENDGSNVTIDGGKGDTYYTSSLGSYSYLGGGNDNIHNNGSNVSIDAGSGNDYIGNKGSNVTINGGTGDNHIYVSSSLGSYSYLRGGKDTISNNGDYVSIDAGDGTDTIDNEGSNVSIDAGDGDDSISNGSYFDEDIKGNNASISGGAGNDLITNYGGYVSIDMGDGDDYIYNRGSNVTIDGGKSANHISLGSYSYLINDDTIANYGNNVSIDAGDGDDEIYNSGDYATINSGTGNDQITLSSQSKNNLILYTPGGGDNGNGGNGNGGNGNGGKGNGNGGDKDNPSGGTSDKDKGDTDASVGKSANGSSGRGTSTGLDNRGGNDAGNVNSYNYYYDNKLSVTPFSSPFDALRTTTPVANQHVYTGGNQIISDYQAGEKIIFGAAYTGALFDDANNFLVGSSTGALAVTNAADKVIDLLDAAGNEFLKAYAASSAGVIDGRGLAGFEVIRGSTGADVIFAGDNGSQLWGGVDIASDTLVGGAGADIFIGGKTQGADIFLNASAVDIVHLNDVRLSDIIGTAEANGAIAVAFNTGNVITVQSSEPLSAAFMLADGSAYRFNHVTKAWQTA